VSRINEIASQLLHHGLGPETPVAIVRWGTYSYQETYISTLGEAADLVRRERITSPALIVIGEVVRLREKLRWFEESQLADYSLPNPFFEVLAS
jgi:siroheme synthase